MRENLAFSLHLKEEKKNTEEKKSGSKKNVIDRFLIIF